MSDTGYSIEGDIDLGGEFTAVPHIERPLFDRYQDADIIIQTRDDVQIRAHMWPLKRDSAFFRDMFSLPQKSTPSPRQLPVITVEEDAETIENMLRLLYPDCGDPDIATVGELRNLVRATHKYQFDHVQRLSHEYARDEELIAKHPVDFYVLALRYEIAGLQKLALSHMKGNLIGDTNILRALDAGDLSGIEYWELMRSHQDQHGHFAPSRKW